MDSFKKVRGITCQLYFNNNPKDVWNLISAPNHLNLFKKVRKNLLSENKFSRYLIYAN